MDTTIFLPPLPEQRAIAHILGTLDDKIELNRRMNETLEAILRALWQKMFVEDADYNWKQGKLENIAEINPLRTIKRGTLSTYLDMSNMPIKGPFPNKWIQREFTNGMKFKNGDTVIARITPCLENGKTAYVNFLNEGEFAWGSTEYIVLAPKSGYCSEWFYFLARDNRFRDYAIQNMTGTSGRQRVSGELITKYEMAIPPVTFTKQFCRFAQPVMEYIKRISFENYTIAALRDTLLPKLISGEVKVKNTERYIAAASQ